MALTKVTYPLIAGEHNSPDNFGGTDAQKLQSAIDYSIANGYQSVFVDRLYDITGSTLTIDKGIIYTEGANNFARKRITFNGSGAGEIRKTDTGFMFSASSARAGDIAFDSITFSGNVDVAFPTIVSGLNCFDCDQLIRIATTNCTFRNLDYVWHQLGTVTSAMQSVKSVNDTYTKNNVILHFNEAWDVVFDGGLMEDGVQFLSCVGLSSAIRNLVVNNGCTIEGMTGTAIELNCVHTGTKIVNSYFEANQNHIQMNRYNYGVSICRNSFLGRGSIAIGDLIRCIDVAVGDFPIIVDGNVTTETNTNTTLIYIDETSAYNVDGRNLIGNNDTLGATLVNVTDRYIDMVSIGNGFQNRWATYSPTLAWTGATPTGVSTNLWYKQIGTTVFIKVKISATDGNNATGMTMTLPLVPKFTNKLIYVPVYQAIGASVSTKFLYVRDDNVNNDVTWLSMGGQTFDTRFELSYEIE
jgi:hypothetical protein